jgi:NAD(P)-dependent dehydrogenase (short-subunit alcohol dehydrogenase family)
MTQRTWFITGVNSGFGRNMTEQLLEHGDRVAGTVRKMDSMNDLMAKYGDRLWLAHLDVTDTPGIKQVVDKGMAESTSGWALELWAHAPLTCKDTPIRSVRRQYLGNGIVMRVSREWTLY